MKTVLNEQNEESIKEKKKTKTAERIEALLKLSFMVVFVLLILVQSALTDSDIRALINRDDLDGKPLENEAYLFEPCKLELKLNNINSCPRLKVLVNGDEYGAFGNDTILLELKDGDVIELDASYILVSAEVQISAVSRNIEHLLGRVCTAAGGIVPVAVIHSCN